MILNARIKGLGMNQRLKRFRVRFETDLVRNTLRLIAYQVAERARSIVPVREGNLKKTIRIQEEPEGVYLIAGREGEVEYAASVEFGTRHGRKAQPYIRPALNAISGRGIQSILRALREKLRTIVSSIRSSFKS